VAFAYILIDHKQNLRRNLGFSFFPEKVYKKRVVGAKEMLGKENLVLKLNLERLLQKIHKYV
jgi:hypothetical protein